MNEGRQSLGALMGQWGKTVATVDARSLAVFRMGLALVVLWDAGQRWGDVPGLYSDGGIFPRELIAEEYGWQPWTVWGVWMQGPLGETVAGTRFLLGVLMAVAVGMLVGWRTRWVGVLVWLLLIQLHNRNPFVLHGGDTLLRTLLFWLMFLPSGRCFSLDQLAGRERGPIQVSGVPALCLMAQLVMMYFFTAVLKSGAAWRSDFTAAEVALNYDQLVKPFGEWLRGFPLMLKAGTLITMVLEMGAPLAVGVTAFWPRARIVWVGLMLAFHVALGLALELEIFPWICGVGWLLLLPREFWRGVGALPVREGGSGRWLGWMRNGCLLSLLVLVMAWNVRSTDFDRHKAWFPQRFNGWVQALRLDQYWSMFAPYPTADDGWFVILGTTSSGELVDLFRGRETDFSRRPERIADDYANSRWAKAFEHLRGDGNDSVRSSLVRYLERRWNEAHTLGEQLVGLEFRWVPEGGE